MFVKVPENVNDPESVAFFREMSEIDEVNQRPDTRKILFGDERAPKTINTNQSFDHH